MKNAVFWDIKPQSVPNRRHIVSPLQNPAGGLYSGDYEECHLLEYKTPVRTSQETHYFSATVLS
jgi:hypothetical protein